MGRFRIVSLACVLLVSMSASPRAQEPSALPDVEGFIERLGEVIEREYAEPDIGTEVRKSLREGLSEGRFQSLYTAADIATSLTQELQLLTQDRRLSLSVVKNPGAGADLAPSPTLRRPAAAQSTETDQVGPGLPDATVLPGNVGNLRIRVFADDGLEAIATAMRQLRDADALIIDVRDAVGDSVEAAATLASYLFTSPSLPLLDIINRSGQTDRYSSRSAAAADRNEMRPLYVLTSSKTGPAGELFALVVQERRRGESVGETTAGVFGPTRIVRIDGRLDVTIPSAQVRSGFSGKKLTGSGVKPDVVTGAEGAVRAAHLRALRRLIDSTSAGARRDRLMKEVESVELPTSR